MSADVPNSEREEWRDGYRAGVIAGRVGWVKLAPTPEGVARIQDHVHDLIDAEIDRQDEIHPQGYVASRDGVRFGLCTVEDELGEAVQAWRDERRVDGWMQTEEELTQALAVGARLLRSLILARSDALSTSRVTDDHSRDL